MSEEEEMTNNFLTDFIQYAKNEYGLTIEPIQSDTPDSFEKIFAIDSH